MARFLVFEAASGYCLFEVHSVDNVQLSAPTVQASIADLARFSKLVSLSAFKPFSSAVEALEQINAVSESIATEMLIAFLTTNLPKVKKKAKFELGVQDSKLASAILEATGIPCTSDKVVHELARGIRMHLSRFVKQLEEHAWQDAQRGLAHSYSRAKVKFNVNRVDNMIIQAIALLDTLDKDVNTFVMRVREWYGWHFPELGKIVADNFQFARVVMVIQARASLNEATESALTEITGSAEVTEQIVRASKTSMGQDISPLDMENIKVFAARVISLAEYRQKLHTYLHERMQAVAPNLSALIGEVIGARLISHAGSLTNLAKAPASTVQILGAEKALFRALKTRGNTPKYGLIFHSTFIGRAKLRNKGRISRYLANKCSIATRIDAFMDQANPVFGEKLREQVEERLRFYEDGVAPRKNSTVMEEAMKEAGGAAGAGADAFSDGQAPQGRDADMDGGEDAARVADDGKAKKKKKKKKVTEAAADAEAAAEAPGVQGGGITKKKKDATATAKKKSKLKLAKSAAGAVDA